MLSRKDRRPLVTEHRVSAYDRIDFIPADELEIPASAIVCSLGQPLADTLMMLDEDPSSDDFDAWGV